MKHTYAFTCLSVAAMMIISCNNAAQPSATHSNADSASIANTPAVDNANNDTTASQQAVAGPAPAIDPSPLDKNSGAFASAAASGGLMEVSLGQLAQQKANSRRVKDFGAMMVSDHSKLNTDLANIAGAKNFALPVSITTRQQHFTDELMKKEGKEFDRSYMKIMVEDHKEDIRAFEKAAANAGDTTIKAFASRTLPVLRLHLDSAMAVLKSLR